MGPGKIAPLAPPSCQACFDHHNKKHDDIEVFDWEVLVTSKRQF